MSNPIATERLFVPLDKLMVCRYCGEPLDFKDELVYMCHRACCEAIDGHTWEDSDDSDGYEDDGSGVSFHDVSTICTNCGQQLYDW